MTTKTASAMDVPIWWNRDFMQSQPVSIDLHTGTTGLIIPFHESKDLIEVGFVGPYGGVFSPNGNSQTYDDYYREWNTFLSRFSHKEVMVRIPPQSHFGQVSELNESALRDLGFTIKFQDLNQSISLGKQSKSMNRNRLRDLDRAKEVGLEFRTETLNNAFNTIRRNRASKGFPLTLREADLFRLSETFPNIIFCNSVALQGVVQAASICFRVNHALAYVFMWGHDTVKILGGPSMTLLASELVRSLSEKGYSQLCLGTSSIEGTVNDGLKTFKASLGAYAEYKKTFFRAQQLKNT